MTAHILEEKKNNQPHHWLPKKFNVTCVITGKILKVFDGHFKVAIDVQTRIIVNKLIVKVEFPRIHHGSSHGSTGQRKRGKKIEKTFARTVGQTFRKIKRPEKWWFRFKTKYLCKHICRSVRSENFASIWMNTWVWWLLSAHASEIYFDFLPHHHSKV